MNRTACATLLTLLLASPATPQEPTSRAPVPLIVGTWRLNVERSKASVPPGYIEIRQYAVRPDGFLVGVLINGTSQAYHWLQFVAKSDGKDYPEYSDQIVGDFVAAGTPTPRTYAERQLDQYVTEWIDKVNGRVTGQGRKVVSNDGKTLTITVVGSPNVRIYDRQ
jgi:hypothetical protein